MLNKNLLDSPKKQEEEQFEESSPMDEKGMTKEQQSIRARKNWAILRNHIRQMRFTVNWLVQSLDEANDVKQDTGGVYDGQTQGSSHADNRGENSEVQYHSTCLNKIVIHPLRSSWLAPWRYVMNMLLFYGYFNDPYHIAFHLTDGNKRTKNYDIFEISFVFDIFLTLNILLSLVTAYQHDVKWETDLIQIVKNYILRDTFVFDVCSTIPMLIVDHTSRWYFLKIIRFIHIKTVYSCISNGVQFLLSRMNLDKSTTEKTSMILDMIIYMFSAIHILGCCWIGIGFTVQCSWLEAEGGGCNPDNKVVDPTKDGDLYIQSIYWVITTLTTVGYGDFKGYTPAEYGF